MPATIIADKTVLNSAKFHRELDRLMGASIGVIAIRTREFERAKLLLHEWASMRQMSYNVWDIVHGFQRYREIPSAQLKEGEEPELVVDGERMAEYLKPYETIPNTLSIVEALEHFEKREKDHSPKKEGFLGVLTAIAKDDLNNPMIQQMLRDHVQRAYDSNDWVVMLLPLGSEIPMEIQGDVEIIDLDPPSFAELKDIFDDMTDAIAETAKFKPSQNDIDNIVQNGLGMTAQEFDNSLSLAVVDCGSLIEQDDNVTITADNFITVVRRRKLEVLKQTQMLELMPQVDIKEVGGLDLLKADLMKTAAAFTDEARAFGIPRPKGFICVGPPGTGKSLICKVTSSVLQLPSIRFDMSAVFQGIVGSSEANMRMALKMVEDMAPCILFIDEIEKSVPPADSSGDSGVGARVLGTFLTWLNDREERGIPVYVIASANDVTRLPPELLRMGRFDKKWALTFPSRNERADILRIHVEKRGHSLPLEDYKRIAAATDTFVGAELEGIVAKALLEDFVAGHKALTYATLKEVAQDTKPQIRAFPERIQKMRDWAENHAAPASSTASFDEEGNAEPQGGIRIRKPPRKGGKVLRSTRN